MKSLTSKVALAVPLALAMVAAPASVAHAAESTSGERATFAAQTRQAGLTSAGARQLQSKVDNYLAAFGGTQVSANKVEIAGVGSIVVAAPGQKYATDLAKPQDMYLEWPWYLCDNLNFCMFRGMGYTGDKMSLFHCTEVALRNWVGWGSYINDQSEGTLAVLYDRAHAWYVGSVAKIANAQFNWDPVWYVDPC